MHEGNARTLGDVGKGDWLGLAAHDDAGEGEAKERRVRFRGSVACGRKIF